MEEFQKILQDFFGFLVSQTSEYSTPQFDKENKDTLPLKAVEIPRPDGSICLYIGRLIGRNMRYITLVDATWVAMCGRRSSFFYGEYDDSVEWEPFPDDTVIELPAQGAVVMEWANDLDPLRSPR